ncbi:MAG: phosphatidylinositol mannoside acyltransferase [Acidimicrobiales bacterium]
MLQREGQDPIGRERAPRGAARASAIAPSVRGRATNLVYRGLGEALRRLPEPIAFGAGAVVSTMLMAARADERAMYARHLRRVLGAELGEGELRRWTRRAFMSYGRYWVEGARLPALAAEVVEARMLIERGIEHLVAAKRAGNGVVLALPHVGSWEWGGAWLALQGSPMTVIAEPVEPPELARWFTAGRSAIGLEVVMLGPGSGKVLLERLRAGGLVGLVSDRDLTGNGVEVDLFGERTTLPAGPATLALRTGAALLTAAVYSGPGRDHTAVVNAPIPTLRQASFRDDVRRVTQEVARQLEGLISRAPEQWHLFQPNWPDDPGARERVRGSASLAGSGSGDPPAPGVLAERGSAGRSR